MSYIKQYLANRETDHDRHVADILAFLRGNEGNWLRQPIEEYKFPLAPDDAIELVESSHDAGLIQFGVVPSLCRTSDCEETFYELRYESEKLDRTVIWPLDREAACVSLESFVDALAATARAIDEFETQLPDLAGKPSAE